jgi:regulator of protease activity HflC (stomatin/prohibitin superfamily)
MAVDSAYGEGVHFVLPWDRMYIYDTRIQKLDTQVKALTQSGLEVGIDITIRFNPVTKLLARLHREVGPEYVQTVVIPEVVSALRAEVGQWEPSSLYEQNVDPSTNAQEIQTRVLRTAELAARRRYVIIDDVIILTVTLPRPVLAAVERKFEQQQARDEYEFRVQRERREADRKAIEADGIQRFQAAIATGINDKYLQWRGIEATLELAKSPNSKVIVIGGGQNGLPLILNPDGVISPPALKQ